MTTNWDDFNIPYEEDPSGDHPNLDGVQLAGAVTITALIIEGRGGLGPFPALLYRFVGKDGEYMPPIMFVSDYKTIKNLDQLTHRAARGAISKAKEGWRLK